MPAAELEITGMHVCRPLYFPNRGRDVVRANLRSAAGWLKTWAEGSAALLHW